MPIDDHRVRLSQISEPTDKNLLRGADERGVVQADENRLLIAAIGQPSAAQPFVEPNGPLDARRAADAVEVVLAHRLDVVDELHVGIHDPDLRALNVANLARGHQHQPAEDRGLLRNQQGGKRHAQDDAHELGAIAGQHAKRNPTHRRAVWLRVLCASAKAPQ
jgi:hypothetical protein